MSDIHGVINVHDEDIGLTEPCKYGRTTPSRVTEGEEGEGPMLHVKHPQFAEHLVLPLEDHQGPCYIHLQQGDIVDTCECLDRFEMRRFRG